MLARVLFSSSLPLAAILLAGCAGSFDVAPKTAPPPPVEAEEAQPDYDAKSTQVLTGSGLTLFLGGLETMAVIATMSDCNGAADSSPTCRHDKDGLILGGAVIAATVGATIYAATRPSKPGPRSQVASVERAR